MFLTLGKTAQQDDSTTFHLSDVESHQQFIVAKESQVD
jgi:hypothetical protein